MDTNLIIRIVVSVIAFANLIASQFGFNPLKLSEKEIYTAVSAIVTLVAWVWGFWKNNNFTKGVFNFRNDIPLRLCPCTMDG